MLTDEMIFFLILKEDLTLNNIMNPIWVICIK